jgi:predicted nucleotidyltransferase component of viral defense system
MAASARELLADKINALAQRGYVRGRDLFDIWFLRQVKCVPVDRDLVALKFADYGTGRPLEVLAQRRSQLDPGLIASEMERFLPLTARRLLAADGHAGVMAAVAEVLAEVLA